MQYKLNSKYVLNHIIKHTTNLNKTAKRLYLSGHKAK